MSELAIPTVHLNGTSKQELLEQLSDTIDALHSAGRLLAAACPNGRDYYLQQGDALRAALDQHEARMAILVKLTVELEKIADAILDQGPSLRRGT